MATEEEKAFEKIERDLSEASESGTADVFDLYGQVMKVHTKGSELTTDFVISELDSGVVTNKVTVYIREQLKTLNMITVFLKPIRRKVMKDGKLVTEEIDNPYMEKIRLFIKGDIVNLAVLARKGVLKSILEYGKSAGIEQVQEAKTGLAGFFDKLKGKPKEEE